MPPHTSMQFTVYLAPHLLVHEGEVVLELRVTGEQDTLPLLVVLRPSGSTQHLQHVQHTQFHPPPLLWTVHLWLWQSMATFRAGIDRECKG